MVEDVDFCNLAQFEMNWATLSMEFGIVENYSFENLIIFINLFHFVVIQFTYAYANSKDLSQTLISWPSAFNYKFIQLLIYLLIIMNLFFNHIFGLLIFCVLLGSMCVNVPWYGLSIELKMSWMHTIQISVIVINPISISFRVMW